MFFTAEKISFLHFFRVFSLVACCFFVFFVSWRPKLHGLRGPLSRLSFLHRCTHDPPDPSSPRILSRCVGARAAVQAASYTQRALWLHITPAAFCRAPATKSWNSSARSSAVRSGSLGISSIGKCNGVLDRWHLMGHASRNGICLHSAYRRTHSS